MANGDYPDYATVVELDDAVFLIDFKDKHRTAEEFIADFEAGIPNTYDRLIADYPLDGASFECTASGMGDRYQLSGVTARILSTGTKHPKPSVMIADTAWPRDNPTRTSVFEEGLGLMGLFALASMPRDRQMSRRRFNLGLAGLCAAGGGLLLPKHLYAENQDGTSDLWTNNGYFIDGRSALQAQANIAFAQILREQGISQRPVIGITGEGTAHQRGIEPENGIANLLTSRTARDKVLTQYQELIMGGLKAIPFTQQPWIYKFNKESDRYNTVDFYKYPEGEINSNTRFVYVGSHTPQAKTKK